MRLIVLHLGEACIDKGAVLTPGVGDGKRIHIPIPAYLIQTDDGKNILVDTGWHECHIDDPEATFRGKPVGDILLPVMRPEDRIAARLGEIGLGVADITHVINTHLHADHCGGNDLFDQVPIYVQRQHHEFAEANDDVFPHRYWNLPQLHYELIDGEPELFPGVQVVLSPGHAPYHQSLLLTLPETGHVLLCSDAIYSQDNVDFDAWGSQAEPEVAKASAAKLIALAKEKQALMVYGHDPFQWRQLRHAPAAYQ